MRRRWTGLLIVMGLPCSLDRAATAPAAELRVSSATLMRNGEPAQIAPAKDRFGPGLDSVDLPGVPLLRTQLRFPCRTVPEGDYSLGLLTMLTPYNGYVGFAEHLPGPLHLYLNDTRLVWTSHTEPLKPENAAEKSLYQAELRCDQLVHLKPTDVVRIVCVSDGGSLTVGPLRFYRGKAEGAVVKLNVPDWGKPASNWLVAKWEETQREGDTVRQPCTLYNPGVLPHTSTLVAVAKDYLQRVLASNREEITLQPGERITKTFELKPGDSGRARLSVSAAAKGVFPPVRLVKFYVNDVTQGPRPNTCLNGEWEMCFVPGVEPGNAPPVDASWAKVPVPSLQSNEKAHCAWYRRGFDAPTYAQGERVLLKCNLLLSEGWFYLNGQQVGHVLHGSLPFEVDLTPAFKPGKRNELFVAVRDWLAYSPKNRDRVVNGEAPLFKINMVDVAGYPGAAWIGIGGPVWLEWRPTVSVDDVFVVTSVRQKKLTLRYRLINTGRTDQTVTLAPTILDAGEAVKTLPKAEVRVSAGQTATTTMESPWPDAKLWWPADPHLYVLQTDLKPAEGAADRHLQRFGFREIWIEGISFFLNGVRVKIRSQWAGGANGMYAASPHWQPDKRFEGIWGWQTRCLHDGDVQLNRTHNQVGVEEACDVADETGLMIKIEDADVAQVNFTFDQVYWNAALKHEVQTVDAYKNHPSVVMWSAGNENMWGWIYQGEAAKVMGNRWQVKICKAMREFDLMRRPIEWEADGDLMGGWEHHALHYPRELSAHPDVPNGAWWGASTSKPPLDGKTVIPYSMGPITLGQKPLTVGEAFWPATHSHPYGETILLGDAPYLGGNYWGEAWMQASQFFVNGFPDVEFALIDIYNPLSLVKPQTVLLKQETRSFVGGQTVKRDVNVHNDLLRPAELALKWSLVPNPPHEPTARVRYAASGWGEVKMELSPAELKRLTLNIPLPVTNQPVPSRLTLELRDSGKLVHRETRDWRIYPATGVRAPAGLKLAVYDPLDQTSAMLRKLKVPFTSVKDLNAALSGTADTRSLLLGRDALKQPPEGPWREGLTAFVRDGGKVLILEQSESPDLLPTPLTHASDRRTTIAFVRAADHPIMANLTDVDLRWWAASPSDVAAASKAGEEHYVSVGNYRKPIRGNYLPIVDVGAMDGIVETPLLEEYEGKGSFILCQMLLTDKATVAPQAAALLQNLLNYLASPTCYRTFGATAVFAKVDSPLRKALEDSRLVYEELTGTAGELSADKFKAAIVDMASGLDAPTVEALRAFAKAGGHVMLHRPTREHQAVLESLLQTRLRFFPVANEPQDIQYHVFRRSNAGLMAGVSNHEFFWASSACFAEIRHEGCWWSWYKCPPEEFIADYFVTAGDGVADQTMRLTRPGTLLQVPAGSGYFLLNQLRLDQPVADVAVTASRLRSLLLTNLGCTLRSEGGTAQARARRLQQYEFFTVDLRPYANRGLSDNKDAGIVGWTNQGENDMRALPTGPQTFAGVPFTIATPKAAIVLYSTNANNVDLPKEVTGIKIGRKADVLFFLHTAGWCNGTPFKYRVSYEDGSSLEIPIVSGQNVIDWWADPSRFSEAMARYGLFIAWKGDNPMRQGVVLPGYEWVNPHPDKPIRDLDFLTVPESGYGAVPVLAAITGAVSRPREGVVTDVIGTQGIKVKLGTQEQEVYYIGVAGIPKDHAYYAKAVAAHRALVVGQKVLLQNDVVTQDSEGHTIAYVYLGRDPSNINNLVNAKIIGDGLGKLGNFAGNNRQRMYLENLGFIAQQRKAGMWTEAAK